MSVRIKLTVEIGVVVESDKDDGIRGESSEAVSLSVPMIDEKAMSLPKVIDAAVQQVVLQAKGDYITQMDVQREKEQMSMWEDGKPPTGNGYTASVSVTPGGMFDTNAFREEAKKAGFSVDEG